MQKCWHYSCPTVTSDIVYVCVVVPVTVYLMRTKIWYEKRSDPLPIEAGRTSKQCEIALICCVFCGFRFLVHVQTADLDDHPLHVNEPMGGACGGNTSSNFTNYCSCLSRLHRAGMNLRCHSYIIDAVVFIVVFIVFADCNWTDPVCV